MQKDKRSIFERLTGSVAAPETEYEKVEEIVPTAAKIPKTAWPKEEEEEGQLTVDVFQLPEAIVIQSTVAGVKPEDLDVSITQDTVTITGTRRAAFDAVDDDYYYRELYWGKFSRSFTLPQEVDEERAEATIKNGLLTIKLPKIDKNRVQKVKIRNE